MTPPDELEHAALVAELRSALRKDTPAGLSSTQRALIECEALRFERKSTRGVLWLLVACGLLLVLPAAAYFGVVVPERERVAEQRANTERLAAERAIEAQRLDADSAFKLQRAQEEAAKMAAQAQAVEESLAARKQATEPPPQSSRKPRSNPGAAGRPQTKRAASSACDPNDALCGL